MYRTAYSAVGQSSGGHDAGLPSAGGGGGCTHVMHGRRRTAIDPLLRFIGAPDVWAPFQHIITPPLIEYTFPSTLASLQYRDGTRRPGVFHRPGWGAGDHTNTSVDLYCRRIPLCKIVYALYSYFAAWHCHNKSSNVS